MHETPPDARGGRLLWVGAALVGVWLAWSAVRPHDYETWALEVFPAVLGWGVLLGTGRKFPMTPLVYVLAVLHAILLIVGGKYTYAEVPLGNWAREAFNLSRNHYDRLGHFAQGFVPAIIVREVLARRTPLAKTPGWLAFVVAGVCLGISAAYELVEWGVAQIDSGGSTAFLGTQGDVWDTQKDMAMCLIGTLAALATLTGLHNAQLRAFPGYSPVPTPAPSTQQR